MAITPNLFSAKTTDGDSAIFEFKPKNTNRKTLTLRIWGTWNGATVTLYGSHDGTTYGAITNGAFTTDYFDNLNNYNFPFLKLTISSVGGSTSLSAHIQ